MLTVNDFISEGVLPVCRTDSVGHALSLAVYGEARHLPVVDDGRYLVGMVRLATLLAEPDVSRPIGELPFDAPISVQEDAHLYDAVQLLVDRGSDLVPVVSGDGRYVGSIGVTDVLGPVSKLLGVAEPGSVIEVEMNARDFTLRHLVHSIEESGARILSLGTSPTDESVDTVSVLVRVSLDDTSRIRAVLEHFGYRVHRSTGRELPDDELQHRVAEFMHYLDV
ncbi:CBS domain-containing protein [Bacteroidota bacterium]